MQTLLAITKAAITLTCCAAAQSLQCKGHCQKADELRALNYTFCSTWQLWRQDSDLVASMTSIVLSAVLGMSEGKKVTW
jgi:hypothetical protein